VAGEVGRALQRRMGCATQARAADREHGLAEEAHAGARRRGDRLVADGDVDVAAVEIRQCVAGGDADVDARVRDGEGREARDQPEAGEAGRRGDDDGLDALRPRELAGGAVDPRQRLGDRHMQRPAFVRQRQGPVQALEQGHAEPLLECLDLPAHGRLGQGDLLAGAGEAQVARCSLEGHKELERGEREEATHG
jgi:hypothetical protein